MAPPSNEQHKAVRRLAAWTPPEGVRHLIVYDPRAGRLSVVLTHAGRSVRRSVDPARVGAALAGLHVEGLCLTQSVLREEAARWR